MNRSVKLLKFLLWSGLTAVSGTILIAASAYLYLSPSLPSVDTLRDTHLQTPLRVFSKDEKLIAEFGEKRRTPIHFTDTPEPLVKAFLAAEDDRFYHHPGVDIMGLMRAAVQLASTGRIQSGGSTITMQVAKNFFLSHERVFSRKFNEILLALQIEQELTKDEIFELYLNKIYLGNRAYGVEAAAQVYYGKSIDELSLAQWAMIAGLPKAPSRYNPINGPERALVRRNWILGRMLDLGYISQLDYEGAVEAPITASYHGPRIEMQAPYIAEMVRQEMVERFGPETYTEGFKVYTTVDSVLQTSANEAVANGLFAYTERHGYRGPVTNLNEDEEGNPVIQQEEDATALWKKTLKETRSASVLKPAVVTAVEDQSVMILMKGDKLDRIDWDNLKWAKSFINVNAFGYNPKQASDVLKPGDLIWVREMPDGRFRLSQEPEAQSSLISMNPENGAILALVGGFNFYDSMYNRATQAIRQAGSAFKPFVYLAALNEGLTASTIINDAPVVFADEGLEGTWRPNNDNMKFNGPMRLREGLYRSRNLISIRILREVGVNRTVNFLTELGLPGDALTRNLSLALGNVSMTPLELTTGYATIANGGYKVMPYLIQRVDVLDDTVFEANPAIVCRDCKKEQSSPEGAVSEITETSPEPETDDDSSATVASINEAESVMDSRVNYIINDIMRDVIWKGTGKRARALERHDIGGKTGTTNDSKDAWFVGFNPDVLTSVWVGMDNYSTLGRWEYGANAALPIWISYMKTALADQPEKRLPQPAGIETVRIDPKTGQLAKQGDPEAIFELFRKENTPKSVSEGSIPSLEDSGSFKPEDLF
ncbi:penicillin-binding protein 1A [Endozoicomonas numazuensis]|uniref:Penicillin-binding protein 1A n=1 Tax=Endozoicomonas numazuensis TaxID=1137799 RepID=A0A081NKG4_9GAMM|nr:penicillin-binding protein 1A [Endozoicomonas numazuensis]KEQ18937.1 peptidase [Endozoicomonas numazuensis]